MRRLVWAYWGFQEDGGCRSQITVHTPNTLCCSILEAINTHLRCIWGVSADGLSVCRWKYHTLRIHIHAGNIWIRSQVIWGHPRFCCDRTAPPSFTAVWDDARCCGFRLSAVCPSFRMILTGCVVGKGSVFVTNEGLFLWNDASITIHLYFTLKNHWGRMLVHNGVKLQTRCILDCFINIISTIFTSVGMLTYSVVSIVCSRQTRYVFVHS